MYNTGYKKGHQPLTAHSMVLLAAVFTSSLSLISQYRTSPKEGSLFSPLQLSTSNNPGTALIRWIDCYLWRSTAECCQHGSPASKHIKHLVNSEPSWPIQLMTSGMEWFMQNMRQSAWIEFLFSIPNISRKETLNHKAEFPFTRQIFADLLRQLLQTSKRTKIRSKLEIYHFGYLMLISKFYGITSTQWVM